MAFDNGGSREHRTVQDVTRVSGPHAGRYATHSNRGRWSTKEGEVDRVPVWDHHDPRSQGIGEAVLRVLPGHSRSLGGLGGIRHGKYGLVNSLIGLFTSTR